MNFVAGIVGVLFALAFTLFLIRQEQQLRVFLRGVKVGDIWQHNDHVRTGRTCVVVESNTSLEAGPDSWVMKSFGERICYMHHSSRVKGEWVLLMRDGVPTPLHFREQQKRGVHT